MAKRKEVRNSRVSAMQRNHIHKRNLYLTISSLATNNCSEEVKSGEVEEENAKKMLNIFFGFILFLRNLL